MKGLNVDDKIRTACSNVKKILNGNDDPKGAKPMVLRSRHSGPAVQYSHGLSVYFPWSNVLDSYEELEFANDTNWRRFLLKYVEITRRAKRPCPKDMKQLRMVEGQLFFNPAIAGFDFLLTENKDAPTVNRFLGNKVGGMKNPPIDHVVCDCRPPAKEPRGKDKPAGEKQQPEEAPETQTNELSAEASDEDVAASAEPSEESNIGGSVETGARRPARKK
jgi:hypothetical protein